MDASGWLWQTLLVGLLVARLAYVFQWQQAYLRDPLAILDVRDGGWDVAIGGAAAFVYASALARRRPQAKRPLAAAGIVTAAIAVIGTIALAFFPGQPTMRVPALDLQALDGHSLDLQEFAGSPLVVNLWATWCGPCRREMPVLQRAQSDHPAVRFVFINQGETATQVDGFLRDEKLVIDHVLLDPRHEAGKAFGRLALPTTLFFDADGRLVASRIGELSDATLAQRLRQQAAAQERRLLDPANGPDKALRDPEQDGAAFGERR